MKKVTRPFSVETEVKRSKFLSTIVPFDALESIRRELRQNHPKASHIVWAFRRLNEYGQIVEECSDDGEPKGCAGKPVLRVMQGNELVECAILVVRYFGGIKLGTGGMARAYSDAAKRAVDAAALIPYEKESSIAFFTPYSEISRWEHLIKSMEGLSVSRHFDEDGARWQITAPQRAVEMLQKHLRDARREFSIELYN